ncbi:MAG: hypothetical protein MUF15_03825 [Acidobacteria bacterium]|nr:hypothetical protein [Acidobacteriota bacterium]
MNKSVRFFTALIIATAMVFFFIQCNGNKEKEGVKQGDPQKQIDTGNVKAKKVKSILPKKLLILDLTDEQKNKSEVLYKEIFTPAVLAERTEAFKKLKGLKKDSEEFIKLKKEISEKMQPYNMKFNEKLKEILTPAQQEKYFVKAGK